LFAVLLIGSACSSSQSNNGKVSFEIYIVKDINTAQAVDLNIDKLSIEDEPIITDEDISEYIWNDYKIILKKDERLKKRLEDKLYMKVPMSGKPYVVVCGGEKIYLGAFWTLLSSYSAPKCPTIVIDLIKDTDYLKVDFAYDKGDKRKDDRIKEVFKSLGKLK
jgi:hypothetical protein